jgi:acetylornithine deacetylase
MHADSVTTEVLTEDIIQRAIREHREGNSGHNYDNRYNVYARFNGAGDSASPQKPRKSILFNGHVDTMPPGDESAWTAPPHSALIKEGKLYGLGVCDMKGGLMASILAVKLLQDAGVPIPTDVIIASVCDEEGGGNGSIVAAMGGLRADAVVVCEPTEGEILAAHMGFVFFQVDVPGVAVHSGSKVLGVNAIDKAMKIMHELEELEHSWLLRYKHPLLPPPSGNVGVIQGGTAGSTVPDACTFKTCVHYHPNTMSYGQVVKEYQAAIDRCCDGDEFLRNHRPRVTVYQSGGAFEMDTAHPLVGCFARAWEEVCGTKAVIAGSPAGCDSRVWRNIARCPTVQFGPGKLQQCHAVDEYLEVESFLQAIQVYARLIVDWGNQ